MRTQLHPSRLLGIRSRLAREGGYVALIVALTLPILFGMAAFSIDIGRWYITGQKLQRAADAAALAGVPSLPGDQATAFSTAQTFATANGYTNGVASAVVTPAMGSRPTRLRVTIKKTVTNTFGKILRVPTTTITRTAVADYAGPVPMGSPCNEMGNDPNADASTKKSTNCGSQGQFWGATGSPSAPKVNGDAYQMGTCTSANDACAIPPTNDDYDPNGHFYAVTLTRAVANLRIEAFDPAFVDVGTNCQFAAAKLTAAAAIPAASTFVTDPTTRYAGGTGNFCTGDNSYDRTNPTQMSTMFTIRKTIAKTNDWDPLSYQVMGGNCVPQTYTGFSGDLSNELDKTKGNNTYLGQVFRNWNQICQLSAAPVGSTYPLTYLVQVQTNGLGADAANGQNNYALRAFSSTDTTAKDAISISAYNNMTIYANLPAAATNFHLARVPSSAAGQVLNVGLYDVGDAATSGTVKVVAPADSGVTFSNCTGIGPVAGALPTCQITTNSTTFQGKWETIGVPIPAAYACNDADVNGCWVLLNFNYSAGGNVYDTTSWTASIEGDPVRLVE